MEFVVKYQGVEHRLTLSFGSCTLADLGEHLQELTATHFSTQKLIGPHIKGTLKLSDHPSESLNEAGVLPGKPYTLIGSSMDAVRSVQSAKELPRMRGFEEETQRETQRRKITPSALKPPDIEFSFGRYEVLQGALHPPPDGAMKLLYRLANDAGIIGIMQKRKWKVGLLSEMSPKGKVGVSRVCVLGYNVNKGQEISLRLRTDDKKGFRKYAVIRQTLIHELTHMVWSDHDDNFKRLNSQLQAECDQFLQKSQGGFRLDASAVHEDDIEMEPSTDGHVLGGRSVRVNAATAAREAAIKRAELVRKQSDRQ